MMTTAHRYPKEPITEVHDTNSGKSWLIRREDPKKSDVVNIPVIRSLTQVENVHDEPYRKALTYYLVAARHDRSSRRGALRFDVEVRQAETFGSQLVEPGRRCSPDDSASVEARLAPTEVVQKDEDDVCLAMRPPATPLGDGA